MIYAPMDENAAAVGRMPMAVNTVGRNFIFSRALLYGRLLFLMKNDLQRGIEIDNEL